MNPLDYVFLWLILAIGVYVAYMVYVKYLMINTKTMTEEQLIKAYIKLKRRRRDRL